MSFLIFPYANNTVKTYVTMFEAFINYYKEDAGKGNKDRYTLLSQTVLTDLSIYFKKWKPKEYLFEGLNGGKYSPESIVKIIKRAAHKAKIA